MNEREDDCAHIAKNEDSMKRLNDRRVLWNHLASTSFAQGLDDDLRRFRRTDGIAIDLNQSIAKLTPFQKTFEMKWAFRHFALRKRRQPVKKSVDDEAHVNSESDHGEERQILQETGAVAFGCLSRVLAKKLRAVDSAHQSVLAVTRQSSRNALNMGRDSQEINLVRHLNDARAGITGLLDRHLAFRKSFQEIARQSVGMSDESCNVEVLVTLESFKHLVAKRLDKETK